jgi:phenylalanyl-tRNA synthetase beta chain
MEFSLRWLADYVDLPEGPEGPEQLAKRLTGAGFAVDGLVPHGDDPENWVIDIDVTTNRTDAMNHFGLAREIAVLYDRPLRPPASLPAEGTERVEEAARVEIQDPIGCPRYTARVIRGVKIGPSPDWLRARLEAIGLRPISNVVDVTNFILWELGQPLHAFDLAKLAGSRIVVRKAEAGETLVTLDGVERKLDPEMLVIADAERAVALGGVMGGLDSEVTAGTSDILLESAHFDRKVVRRTARALGMHTDASHRFERGADPEICALAVGRAARLIAEIAGGTVLAGTLDVRAGDRVWQRQGRLELAKLNAFAGVEIAASDAERWLTGLGFALAADADETAGAAWQVTVPSWRHYDFEPRPTGEIYPADLYEEVIRIHGFDSIPAALPAVAGADAPRTPAQIRREKVRRLLAASGFTESIHFAFLAPEAEAALPNLRPETPALRLANPLSEQYSVLRRTLSPNLVETARFNQRRGAGSVRLFEVATVFFGQGQAIPEQPEHVALV